MRQTCRVVWQDGYTRTVIWKHSLLVKLLFTGAFTLGDTVRVNPNLPTPLASHLRHEFQHSRRQAESGQPLWRWVLRYVLSPGFREIEEFWADQARREWWENGVKVSDPMFTVLS